MTWDSGTITSAAPWAALSTKLKAMVGGAGVENWSFLENVPAGTGTGQSGSASYSLDVFKCAGTNTPYVDVMATNLLNASDTNAGSATSVVFGSVPAMAASKVFTVVVMNTKASAADDPTAVTLDGANAPTFTKIVSKASGDANTAMKMTVWMGKSGGAAPTGTNLTINYGANVETSVMVIFDQWDGLDETLAVTGVDATGATEVVVQTATGSGTTQTAHTATLGALLSGKSIVLHAACQTASAGNYSAGVMSGWTSSAVTNTVATPTACGRSQYKVDNEETTATLTLSSATSEAGWCSIALELQRKISSSLGLSTLNSCGHDLFFILEIPVPDGAVNSVVNYAERYNGLLKYFSSMPPTAASNSPVGTGYWRTVGFYPYASVTGNNRANLGAQALNTSGFDYSIKLTKDMVLIGTKVVSSTQLNGIAIIDSFVTYGTDECPIIILKQQASSGTLMTFSNLPSVATAVGSGTWSLSCVGWVYAVSNGITNNAAGAQDLWAGQKVYAGRIVVVHSGAVSSPNLGGYVRGLLKTDVLCMTSGGAVNLNDTMTIGGNTWTVIGNGYFGNLTQSNIVILVRAT